MSKKNSIVNLKHGFRDFKDLSKIFLSFKKKLDILNKKKYLVAVSGGPDSLALVALTRAYSYQKKIKFYYVLVDHNLRKNSNLEAKKVKNLFRKNKIILRIFLNKKKIIKNIQAEARNLRYEILVNYCKKNKIKTIGFSNFSGGYLNKHADISIHSPINNYGVGEDINHILMHLMMQFIAKSNLKKKYKKLIL